MTQSPMIHWLLQSLDDCPEILRERTVPEWLGEEERQRLGTFKIEKRRRDWLLGRWTAKRLVQSYLAAADGESLALASLYVGSDADGAPYVSRSETGERLPVSLSISHSHGRALCALCPLESDGAGQPSGSFALGCDLEFIEPRAESFVRDFFTAEELAAVAQVSAEQRDLLVAVLWSAKEAVLKAIREGLRINTRRISCRIVPPQAGLSLWTPLSVTPDAGLLRRFPGRWSAWWRADETFVLTLALCEISCDPAAHHRPRVPWGTIDDSCQ